MRILALLFTTCLVAVFVLGQTLSSPSPQNSSQPPSAMDNLAKDEIRMRSRVQIQVLPLDQLAADRALIRSFRERVAQAEAETNKLDLSDPAVREQVLRQQQLLRALFKFAEMQYGDAGKSPTALEVQNHLNEIAGQTMCAACHGRIVLKSASETGTIGP